MFHFMLWEPIQVETGFTLTLLFCFGLQAQCLKNQVQLWNHVGHQALLQICHHHYAYDDMHACAETHGGISITLKKTFKLAGN